MRYFKMYKLILLALIMAQSLEVALAQNNTTAIQPQVTSSQPVQLSGISGIEELAQVSGRVSLFNSSQVNPGEAGTTDVTSFANISNIFRPNPSVGITITGVNPVQRWVQITNEGIAAWNLTGWRLVSGGNVTYTFPAVELEDGASLRIREGMGNNSAAEVYTDSTTPLWIGNSITLLNAAGDTISMASVPA